MKKVIPTTLIPLLASLLLAVILASPTQAQKTKRKQTPPPPPPPVQTVSPEELKELSDTASKSRESLIAASNTYRESLERLLELQKQSEERALQTTEKNQKMFELGIIPKRQLEEGEQMLAAAQAKTAETQKQIESVNNLVSEVEAAEEMAKQPPMPMGEFRTNGALVRFVGITNWGLNDFGKVDAFYRLKFGKPLPVSAFGQTQTHNQLGFDHSNAMDVAVHPDSAEGQALVEFLYNQGISFIAIRGAIQGSATGAHIHVGAPSHRTQQKQ